MRTADPPPRRHAESRLASGHPAVKRGRPGARGQPGDDPLSSPAFRAGRLQRVMIAMVLSCRPKLLIADEPTTALDVTVQAQILRLLRDWARASQMAMMLITHDLG